MTSITVNMEKELREQLLKVARKERRSLAFIVRDACENFLGIGWQTPRVKKNNRLKAIKPVEVF